MVVWTKEKVGELSTEGIEALRENALRQSRHDLVQLCDEELARQKPVRKRKPPLHVAENHQGKYVREFHFVCVDELSVVRNADGTIWTRTWVVSEEHAESAQRYGSLVALHSSKAEPSYLQGTIIDWRKAPRERRYSGDKPAQISEGVDFLFRPSNVALPWKGDGAGEKGYGWAPIP